VEPLEEARDIRKAAAKSDVAVLPALAETLVNLGNVYAGLDRNEQARDSYASALLTQKALGEDDDHQNANAISDTLLRLADVQAETDGEAAVRSASEAVSIRRKLSKIDSQRFKPALAESLTRLVKIMRIEDGKDTRELDREIVDIYEDLVSHGARDYQLDLASALDSQAWMLDEQDELRSVAPVYIRAIGLYRVLIETNVDLKLNLGVDLNNLGANYLAIDDLAKAEKVLMEAVGILRLEAAKSADADPHVLATLRNLSRFYERRHRSKDSRRFRIEADSVEARMERRKSQPR
jgi:tetratricopeptide (TPR) repeat protein